MLNQKGIGSSTAMGREYLRVMGLKDSNSSKSFYLLGTHPGSEFNVIVQLIFSNVAMAQP